MLKFLNLNARIDYLLREKSDSDFDQRIMRRIDTRLRTNHCRGTLSPWEASSVLCWLKKIAENAVGRKMTFQEFQDALTGVGQKGCDSCELFINDHMQFADITSAEVHVNGSYRATIFQDGFPLPGHRGLKFDTARKYIAHAFRQSPSWFFIPGDEIGNADRHLYLMSVLEYIREDEIAYVVLDQWINKKGIKKKKDTTIPKDVWEADIRKAERQVFEKLLITTAMDSIDDARAILEIQQDEGACQELDELIEKLRQQSSEAAV